MVNFDDDELLYLQKFKIVLELSFYQFINRNNLKEREQELSNLSYIYKEL